MIVLSFHMTRRTQSFTRRASTPRSPLPPPSPSATASTTMLPVCTPTTLPHTECTMSWLPWRFVSRPGANTTVHSSTSTGNVGVGVGTGAGAGAVSTTVIQVYGNASQPPIPEGDSIVVPIMQPPLIRVAGSASNPISHVTFRSLHVGYTRDPCPSQFAPRPDGKWSQAWNDATVAPDVPRGSVNNPGCDCLMIVGGIETGIKSTISAVHTDAFTVNQCMVGPNGGTGISVARSHVRNEIPPAFN